MKEQRLTELEALAQAATPGAAIFMTDETFYGQLIVNDGPDDGIATVAVMPELDDRPRDFEYLAASWNAIPELCAEVRRLQAEVSALLTALSLHLAVAADDPCLTEKAVAMWRAERSDELAAQAVVIAGLRGVNERQQNEVAQLLRDAVDTDGGHHKQWYLEKIAALLAVELPDHERGIAP